MRMRIQYQNNENTDTAFRAPPAHTCGACLAVLVIVVMRGDRIGSDRGGSISHTKWEEVLGSDRLHSL